LSGKKTKVRKVGFSAAPKNRLGSGKKREEKAWVAGKQTATLRPRGDEEACIRITTPKRPGDGKGTEDNGGEHSPLRRGGDFGGVGG